MDEKNENNFNDFDFLSIVFEARTASILKKIFWNFAFHMGLFLKILLKIKNASVDQMNSYRLKLLIFIFHHLQMKTIFKDIIITILQLIYCKKN